MIIASSLKLLSVEFAEVRELEAANLILRFVSKMLRDCSLRLLHRMLLMLRRLYGRAVEASLIVGRSSAGHDYGLVKIEFI